MDDGGLHKEAQLGSAAGSAIIRCRPVYQRSF